MDETPLTAKRRLKVLAGKGMYSIRCGTFTASSFIFDLLMILPNKKNHRILESYNQLAYFASSHTGWMTSNIFIIYCLYLVCQLSIYSLGLPPKT